MADVQKLIVNNTDYDIDDPNDVEKEDGELADTVINYESATTPTIGSFTQFLDRFVSGTKVGAWFKNFRAGCDFLLHIGSLVNNCVSDNEALPLAAAQGKVLMDLITDANATIEENKSDLQSQINTINNDLSELNSEKADLSNAFTFNSTGSKQLTDGEDLDDYTSPGNYYCTVANTEIANTPISDAFNMKIFYGNGQSYPIQLFFSHRGDIYIRAYNSDAEEWRDWKTVVS